MTRRAANRNSISMVTGNSKYNLTHILNQFVNAVCDFYSDCLSVLIAFFYFIFIFLKADMQSF